MSMKVKFFYHSYIDNKENFEQKVNDFMATVEVLDVKFSGTPSSESFNSVAIVLVLYR